MRASACASARQRNVDRHLVAVKVSVVGGAGQRVQLERAALNQHRLERLNAQTVQRRRAVEQNRVLLDDNIESVPDLGLLHGPPSSWRI